ncbi:MAG: ComEC/Rec2 family competence protein [Candidatus Saccharibacteria bacterium]|nr:ComEC/Rec2 family competence protein [Candidatus Saccharibacteria bacterium]
MKRWRLVDLSRILSKNIHQSYFVVFFAVGVIFGTILALVFRINFFCSVGWLIFVILASILVYFVPRLFFITLALISGMVLAFFRVANELVSEQYVRGFYGDNVIVWGEVDGDPEADASGINVKLKNLRFSEEGEYKAAGSLFVSLRKNDEVLRGDTLVLSGKLVEGFGTYVGYMYRPKIKKIYKASAGDFVLKIRNWFAERIRGLISAPEVDLGLSYLLGMKAGLSEELAEKLRIVGLVHIVVASGAHLSILVGIAKKIFGKVSRLTGLLFSALFVVFFMAMVGWTPSILRAGIMALLTLFTGYVGRKIRPWRMILIVAAGTLVINPMFIINLGWLLSFASFSGIMILGPRLVRFFYGDKKPRFIGETIITTVAATIMTLPISLYYYGTLSLISIVANLLILPTLPYAMGLVFVTGVISGVPVAEGVVAFLATRLIDFHIFIVSFLGEMEYFLVKIEPYEPRVFLIYVVIFGAVMVLRK